VVCVFNLSRALLLNGGKWNFDPASEVDLYVLHCVYLPRINKALTEFSRASNSHPTCMQMARNWSPHQMMLNNMIREEHILDTVDSDYGIDLYLKMILVQ